MMEITYIGALIAGLLSFVSPCVLPLIPAYISFLGGASLAQLTEEDGIDAATQKRVFYAAIAFVLGFSTVFIALGATATAISAIIAQNSLLLGQIAGVIIIVLGLHFLGVFRIGMLMREARFHVESRPAGLIGAYFIGLAFAFGWTPCVGPVLAAILLVASSEDSIWYGASLLGTYGLGIGVPFLAASLVSGPFVRMMRRFGRHVQTVEKVLGVLLIATGVLFLTGAMSDMAFWLLEAFPSLGYIG